MRLQLTFLLVDGDTKTSTSVVDVVSEWASTGIVSTVGVVSRQVVDPENLIVEFFEDGQVTKFSIYDLLSLRLWDSVTIASLRTDFRNQLSDSESRFESGVLDLIDRAFSGNQHIVIRSLTVSIASRSTAVSETRFSPRFNLHLVHEDTVMADPRAAAVPITDATKPMVLCLTALLAGGGFVWQRQPLIGELKDAPEAQTLPARVVRACLRVVNGGRLADRVIAGAFPESGPWSVPPEVSQCRSAPIGTPIPETLTNQFVKSVGFVHVPWAEPAPPRPKKMGILQGLVMFVSQFGKVISELPSMLVERGRDWVGSRAAQMLQNLTYGEDSSILLSHRPMSNDGDQETLVFLQRSGLPDLVAPMADARPWEELLQTSFGLVDAGRLPKGVDEPKEGSRRIIYVDPRMIGPAPSDQPFRLDTLESVLLGLPEEAHEVDSLDLVATRVMDLVIAKYRSGEDIDFDLSAIRGTSRPKVSERPERISHEVSSDDPASPDRHRPAHRLFSQSEYIPVAVFYQGDRENLLERFSLGNQQWTAAKEEHEPVSGPWVKSGRCDHCGTQFNLGVCLLHEPSGYLVHLGNVCARKIYPNLDSSDESAPIIEAVERRWTEWKAVREQTFLWKVARHIEGGITSSRASLSKAVEEAAEDDPDIASAEKPVRKKIRRTGLFGAILVVATLIAGIALSFVFAIVSLIYCIIAFGGVVLGWITRLAMLTRDLVRVQFRLKEKDSARLRAMKRVQHDAKEYAKLLSAREQFKDWQAVIREVVHSPFGRLSAESLDEDQLSEIKRPQSFLLGVSAPNRDQLISAQIRAQTVTIHEGWMSEIYDSVRSSWESKYRKYRFINDAEDLNPAADNTRGDAVASTLADGEKMYYPRSDFRRRLQSGDLRESIVNERIKMIHDVLAEQPIDNLMSNVKIDGPGAALSGQSMQKLLGGVGDRPVPTFAGELFGVDNLDLRINNVDFSRQGPAEEGTVVVPEFVGFGRVFTAAAWRMDFSPPVKASFVALSTHSDKPDAEASGPSVV